MKSFFLLIFALPVLATPKALPGLKISEDKLKQAFNLGQNPDYTEDLEAKEIRYQKVVERQTLSDLLEFYKDSNRSRIQISYPSFTPGSSPYPGPDFGRGFHVVKRLDLVGPNGKMRRLEINEQWPENSKDQGLLLPNEIRIKSQVFDGERRVEGSHELYLYDKVELAWNEDNSEVRLFRRTGFRFDPQGKQNWSRDTRAAIGVPFSCLGCHQPGAGFSQKFLKPSESRNFESIVQDSHFTLPYSEMMGVKEYFDYLKKEAKREDLIVPLEKYFSRNEDAFAVPALAEELRFILQGKSTIDWLQDELVVNASNSYLYPGLSGVYSYQGSIFVEATAEIFEGRFRWWDPQSVVPLR